MQNKFVNSILAAAVAVSLGACSATTPVAEKPQSGVATEIEHTRVLPLEGGRNFRDLGGYRTEDGREVKWGKLYRSGVLTNLTDNDYDYLEKRGIETVVDFRSSEERKKEPTHWRAGEIERLTWDYAMGDWEAEFAKVLARPDFQAGDMVKLMADMYPDLVRQQIPAYRAMFDSLLESDEPLLFHCTAGKDRTGVGAALLLTALGVDRETVMEDYLLSSEVLKDTDIMKLPEDASEKEKRMYAFFSRLSQPVKDALVGVQASYLESAFAEMERQAGSVEGFIEQELDVDKRELAQLRATYLQ
ncbi:tyrosine-protein phosphatase [Microbulbifer halophilus]|uniref:Tyrosine-protein phosphatase n=1 Tax=Microbulbifer halophilus TaxID=453963 RepID=A0ABW5EAR4_9GAMM|nr:tyrosine-protein phosphatase [Microbulbifer halophilus]MCW8125722.1 tyrosine-protein phosphatase [Microbulbifer halophilus]